MSLARLVGEYFFGTETRKAYELDRGHVEEYVQDEDFRHAVLKNSRVMEFLEVWGGRYLLTTLTVGSVLTTAITRKPLFLVAAGGAELMRLGFLYFRHAMRASIEKGQQRDMRSSYSTAAEGDTWKQD